MQLRSYYDYFDLKYTYLSVDGDQIENYHLVPYDKTLNYIKYDYSNLIHICDLDKMNMIGDRASDLYKSWYLRNKNNASMKTLKDNLLNFFQIFVMILLQTISGQHSVIIKIF